MSVSWGLNHDLKFNKPTYYLLDDGNVILYADVILRDLATFLLVLISLVYIPSGLFSDR